MRILFEDNDIIVVEKPAGVSSQPDRSGEPDLTAMLGGVYAVHRLDKPVGGVMVFAKNRDACAALSHRLVSGGFTKKYLTAVCGCAKDSDTLTDYLVKNERLNMSRVVHKNTPHAKEAVLLYKKLAGAETRDGGLSLLEVTLMTGRHHQIRVQLANAGVPVWGDAKYNKAMRGENIALWAYLLEFTHPVTGKDMGFIAAPHQRPFDLFDLSHCLPPSVPSSEGCL